MKASILVVLALFVLTACRDNPPVSASGVSKASVDVPVGPDGLTSEQRNIKVRLLEDNRPGAIKHLYVISAWSGDVLIYSTVKGKVTSGGKRLTPTSVATVGSDGLSGNEGFLVQIGDQSYYTSEVLQDDGTYGSSGQYLFWQDSKDNYHQHYLSGGQIVHISSQPLSVPKVILNMETAIQEE